MTTDELVARVSPAIQDLGRAFFFAPEARERARALGLDGLGFYVLGRGGCLGDVDPEVVGRAFGYFEPAFLAARWNEARSACDPLVASRAFLSVAADFGRARFAEVVDLDRFCAAADAVNRAIDPAELTLYAAMATEPLADDAPARSMQLLHLLREHRGSAHLVALHAVGLDPRSAHAVHHPDRMALFGWPDDGRTDGDLDLDLDAVAKLAAAEVRTDEIVRPAYAVLDEHGWQAFLAGLDGIEAALAAAR